MNFFQKKNMAEQGQKLGPFKLKKHLWKPKDPEGDSLAL